MAHSAVQVEPQILGNYCPTNVICPNVGDRVRITFEPQELEVADADAVCVKVRYLAIAVGQMSYHIRHLREINGIPTGVERSSEIVYVHPPLEHSIERTDVLGVDEATVSIEVAKPALSPLEHETTPRTFTPIDPADVLGVRAVALHDRLAELEQERDRIKVEGAIAPSDCWIESAPCYRRKSKQVYYRSNKAMFEPARKQGDSEGKAKRKYIGMAGSDKEKEAQAAISRRDRLAVVVSEIQRLEESID